MNLRRLVARSTRYYWRTGVVVVFGLAIATAVIVGSLVIGDSVKGSIRRTALSRLGAIDQALVGSDYFRRELADELTRALAEQGDAGRVVPLIVVSGAARNPTSDAAVPNLQVIGVTSDLWRLYGGAGELELSGRQVAINSALARDAGVSQGDYLLLTVGAQTKVPTDSLFARRSREDALRSLRVQVAAVLPDDGAGGFRLDPATETPRNLFISLGWLASRLDKEGQANTLVTDLDRDGQAHLQTALAKNLKLADYGLRLVEASGGRYLPLESEGVLLRPGEVGAALQAVGDCGGEASLSSVYIADTIRPAGPEATVPELAYAMAAWLADTTRLTAFAGAAGALESDGLLLNSWAAEDLGAKVGHKYELTYLVPSFEQGYRTETVELRLRGIVKMTGSGADPSLVPDFEGITDAEHVDEWDSPFPVDLRRITDRDEEYWDRYRAAPKAFVSRDTARRMWSSAGASLGGVGYVTSVRVQRPESANQERFVEDLTHALLGGLYQSTGPRFRPVREQALEASKGTSDFSQLFLGMSMFLVLSGAGLAAMLMRLSADRRAAEAGIMVACGFRPVMAARTIFVEGCVLTGLGLVVGTPLGVLYASAIIRALGTWWRDALGTTARLWLQVTPASVVGGALAGLLVGLISVGWAARGLGRTRVLELLSGWQGMSVAPQVRGARRAVVTLQLALLAAVVLIVLATAVHLVPPELAFFGSGAALLLAGMAGASLGLAHALRREAATRSRRLLALRNAATGRRRSLLVIGLLACATFVIVAVAANSRDFSRMDVSDKHSGTGGFSLLATSSVPLPHDFGTPKGREQLGFALDDEAAFEGVEVVSFLVSPGEDISCLNIARPSHPRVLGVSDRMIQRGGFRVVTEQRGEGNPWTALQDGGTPETPVFGDAASVRWQLHSGLGQTYLVDEGAGRTLAFRFVGLLSGSIFQSELLVSESAFRAIYPSVDAPSYFLIAAPRGAEEQVARALRANLGETGLEVRTTREVLDDYIGVQNTYLSMFLALGGLGLLLGTVGMVAVLLRSALERRREFALMLATGFSRSDLARLLVVEHAGLLLVGMTWGALSALVAVAPQLASAQSEVNWTVLVFVLMGIPILGVLACALAARATVGGRVIEALREE